MQKYITVIFNGSQSVALPSIFAFAFLCISRIRKQDTIKRARRKSLPRTGERRFQNVKYLEPRRFQNVKDLELNFVLDVFSWSAAEEQSRKCHFYISTLAHKTRWGIKRSNALVNATKRLRDVFSFEICISPHRGTLIL